MTNEQTAVLLLNIRARLVAERKALEVMLMTTKQLTQHNQLLHRGPYSKDCDSEFFCAVPSHFDSIFAFDIIRFDGLDAFIADIDAQIDLLKQPAEVAA